MTSSLAEITWCCRWCGVENGDPSDAVLSNCARCDRIVCSLCDEYDSVTLESLCPTCVRRRDRPRKPTKPAATQTRAVAGQGIHLRAPQYDPRGPDGRGWNRLSVNAHMGSPADQCALRPRTWAGMYGVRDSRRARWGNNGRCINAGNCGGCPILHLTQDDPKWLPAHTDTVLVRLKEWDGDSRVTLPPPTPYVVDQPELGWASPRYRWEWDALARLRGWRLGRHHWDEHGEGFWLVKEDPAELYGTPKTDY